MEKKNNSEERIELRSEKVRQLIGEIPPASVRRGTLIVAFIFLALATAVALMPFPYSNGESILEHILH